MNSFFKISLGFFLLVGIVSIPLFVGLSVLPIRAYDESRIIINVLEMMQGKNLIVTHFEGAPDMWNTKPPLLIWIQALFLKIGGMNELMFRLPSAIAALLTCLCLYFFSLFYFKNFWIGFSAALILVSSGFVDLHASRTGDYDALLALFTTAACLFFFLYVEFQRNIFLWATLLLTSMACLTKGISGLLFIPSFLIYIIYKKQFLALLKNKNLYLGILVFLMLVPGYYLLREVLNPGFLKAVNENEFAGRYLAVNEGHTGGFWYYFNFLATKQFKYWVVLIPFSILIAPFSKNDKIKKISFYLILISDVFFLIISSSKTKLYWYDLPLIPLLSLLASLSFYFVIDKIYQLKFLKRNGLSVLFAFIFIVLLVLYPYSIVLKKAFHPKNHVSAQVNEYEMSYYLQGALRNKYSIHNCYIVDDGYASQLLFYIHQLNKNKQQVRFKEKNYLAEGDSVIVSNLSIKKFLTTHYHYQLIAQQENISKFLIVSKKSTIQN